MNASDKAFDAGALSETEIEEQIAAACASIEPNGKRILVVVPDTTRTCPVDRLFRMLHRHLAGPSKRLDFLVALGTHPPLPEATMLRLFGLTAAERAGEFADVGLHNHAWQDRSQLIEIGEISANEIKHATEGLFEQAVSVTCNRMIEAADHVLLVGPVFPHEVAGFSGGNKYVAPGIAGAEIIDFFHWLGAIITNAKIIGCKWTPVREVIDRAASLVKAPRSAICLVMNGSRVDGVYHGDPQQAWSAAADHSARIHIVRHPRPYHTVLSCAPEMYDELWVGGKCMYKLEPVVEDGGRLIIFAPHIQRVSTTHGELIESIGYHVRDYFLEQWDRFRDVPGGVLAHSTQVKGTGTWRAGVESPRVEVVLATGIPEATCEKLALGYLDPASIDPSDYRGRESEGVLHVPSAGETLHRLEDDPFTDT